MISLLKEMFSRMVEGKDASLISTYYHPEFLLTTNGQTWDYARFHDSHVEIYQTSIQYAVRYDDETFVESGDRLAARLYITTSRPNEEPRELEVLLIAQLKEGKFYRLWELTWPDWSGLQAFKDI